MRLKAFFCTFGLLLSACGGGDEYNGEPVGSLALIAGASEVVADGNSQIIIRATVLNEQGEPIDNSKVLFSTNLGSLSVSEAGTEISGVATAMFSSLSVGNARITANASGFSQSVSIEVIGGTSQTVDATAISLSVDTPTIKSGNVDNAIITAALLDSNNAVVPGAQVNFSTDSGQLSASTVLTETTGIAQTILTSGSQNYSNRVVTVTASAGSLSRQIPIQITDSSLAIQASREILITGGASGEEQSTITFTATDGNGSPVYNTSIIVTLSGSGSASLSSNTLTTDFLGQADATLTGTSPGTVTLSATALGVTVTKDLTVDQSANAFHISTPASSPTSADIGDNITVTVNAPSAANVTFVTSLGTVTDGGAPASVVTTAVGGGGTATVTLTSAEGGIATVEVFDAADSTVIDRTIVSFASPSASADHITLQTQRNSLALSSGSTVHSTTLTATVFDVNDFPVRDAVVNFTLGNTTGGGEYLNTIYGFTGDDGRITTNFTSGSIASTPGGVTITATSVGGINASLPIVIGGSAASVVIGSSTQIASINNNTAYQAPMSVLVTDSNGNAVANTTINLNIKAAGYQTGYWQVGVDTCNAVVSSTIYKVLGADTPSVPYYIVNEDINENLILDAGEDGNGDGALTPGLSAAGSIPQTVTTDENGLATFSLTFLKQYSIWVVSQITASTMVLGNQSSSSLIFSLPFLQSDADACTLNSSPWGTDDIWRDS